MVGFQQSIYQVSEDERYVNVCVLISNEPAGGIVIPVQIEVEFEAQVFKPGTGAYLGGVLRVLEHPPQLGMHKIKYSLNYKHALGTYLIIHPCITSLTAKFTKLEH